MDNKIYRNIAYKELLQINRTPNYVQLLSTKEWDEKRNEILDRDKCICRKCKKKGHILIDGKGYYEKLFDSDEIKKHMEEWSLKNQKKMDEIKKLFNLSSLPMNVNKESYKPFRHINLLDKIVLNVHHKYYIKDNLPWQYENSSLETLCAECHLNVHEAEEIPVYEDKKMLILMKTNKCKKCKGMGYLDVYNYYMDGVCFSCNGNKFITIKK